MQLSLDPKYRTVGRLQLSLDPECRTVGISLDPWYRTVPILQLSSVKPSKHLSITSFVRLVFYASHFLIVQI